MEGVAGRVSGRVHVIATEEEAELVQVVDPELGAYVTQTTLSQCDISSIRERLLLRFPTIRGPRSNVCYATQNRQNAIKELAQKAGTLFVVGSKTSSNSNRLREVGVRADDGIDETDIRSGGWRDRRGRGCRVLSPERLVRRVVQWLQSMGRLMSLSCRGRRSMCRFSKQ